MVFFQFLFWFLDYFHFYHFVLFHLFLFLKSYDNTKKKDLFNILNKKIEEIYKEYLESEEFKNSIKKLVEEGNFFDYIKDYIETPTEIIKTKKSIEPYNKFVDNVSRDLIEQKKKKKNKIMKKINKKIIHHHKILKMIHIINGKNI